MHCDDATMPRRADRAGSGSGPGGVRAGFTLVELLVAIIIVAVLAAIITPAVMTAMAKAKQAAIKTEIDMLHMAIMNYKSEYGSFPPAADRPTGAVKKHVTRIFPRTNWASFTYDTGQVTPFTAIYLFLSGYGDDPTNPFSGKPKKLFDFDQSRVNTTNNQYAPREKPNSPYIYVPASQYETFVYSTSSFTTPGAQMVPEKPFKRKMAPFTVPTAPDSFWFTNTMPVPAELTNQPTTGQQFFNPDTFQILCAGRDEVFGTDDDLSNFWPGTRRDYLDSIK
ncbi:MAG: type II secretion system protein [Planctomycetes bacterium]|nr:type II secretion system protein [Planctomycetota bacterium]MBM4057930.1 type II secretion system protein [Planctomycetota bacterium]